MPFTTYIEQTKNKSSNDKYKGSNSRTIKLPLTKLIERLLWLKYNSLILH